MEEAPISNAEWQVMRIVWALNTATSTEIVAQLSHHYAWKPTTIKTLLHRLVSKKYLAPVKKSGRAYIYTALVDEQTTIDRQMQAAINKVCQMHRGQTIADMLTHIKLTKDDIAELEQVLQKKKPHAPESLPCDCLTQSACCKQHQCSETEQCEHTK